MNSWRIRKRQSSLPKYRALLTDSAHIVKFNDLTDYIHKKDYECRVHQWYKEECPLFYYRQQNDARCQHKTACLVRVRELVSFSLSANYQDWAGVPFGVLETVKELADSGTNLYMQKDQLILPGDDVVPANLNSIYTKLA